MIKKFFHYSGLEMVLISMHALYLVLDGWRVLREPQRALARSQLQHLLLSHCSLMEVVMGAVFELKSIFQNISSPELTEKCSNVDPKMCQQKL